MDNQSEVENFYERPGVQCFAVQYQNPNYSFELLPIKHFFNAIFVGATGSGKTAILLDLINKMGCFQLIKLFCLNASEPLYEYLKSMLGDAMEIFEGIEEINTYLKDPKNHEEACQQLYIFDDLITFSEQQQKFIKQFHISGRKKASLCGISCVYLAQSYYRIPSTIRSQCSFLIIRKIIGNRDVSNILRECGHGIDSQTLVNMYNYCTKGSDINQFLLIDLKADFQYRFRKNYSQILNPEHFTEMARLKQYKNIKLNFGYSDTEDEYDY